MKDAGKEILFLSGSYEVSLIIGDPFIDNSFIWDLGSISLTFPPSLEVKTHDSVYILKFVTFFFFLFFFNEF